MYFFLNRYQKLKGERAEFCKNIFNKLDDKNQERLIRRGNVTAIVMGCIYAVVLALMIACAVVAFVCKYWWAGVFFCVFSLLIAYLTYSGFSWRKKQGYEYAKLFGEEIIYMLGRQERDKTIQDATIESVLQHVAEENAEEEALSVENESSKTTKTNAKAGAKKSTPKTKKKAEQPAKAETKIELVEEPKKKAGRPAKKVEATEVKVEPVKKKSGASKEN